MKDDDYELFNANVQSDIEANLHGTYLRELKRA